MEAARGGGARAGVDEAAIARTIAEWRSGLRASSAMRTIPKLSHRCRYDTCFAGNAFVKLVDDAGDGVALYGCRLSGQVHACVPPRLGNRGCITSLRSMLRAACAPESAPADVVAQFLDDNRWRAGGAAAAAGMQALASCPLTRTERGQCVCLISGQVIGVSMLDDSARPDEIHDQRVSAGQRKDGVGDAAAAAGPRGRGRGRVPQIMRAGDTAGEVSKRLSASAGGGGGGGVSESIPVPRRWRTLAATPDGEPHPLALVQFGYVIDDAALARRRQRHGALVPSSTTSSVAGGGGGGGGGEEISNAQLAALSRMAAHAMRRVRAAPLAAAAAARQAAEARARVHPFEDDAYYTTVVQRLVRSRVNDLRLFRLAVMWMCAANAVLRVENTASHLVSVVPCGCGACWRCVPRSAGRGARVRRLDALRVVTEEGLACAAELEQLRRPASERADADAYLRQLRAECERVVADGELHTPHAHAMVEHAVHRQVRALAPHAPVVTAEMRNVYRALMLDEHTRASISARRRGSAHASAFRAVAAYYRECVMRRQCRPLAARAADIYRARAARAVCIAVTPPPAHHGGDVRHYVRLASVLWCLARINGSFHADQRTRQHARRHMLGMLFLMVHAAYTVGRFVLWPAPDDYLREHMLDKDSLAFVNLAAPRGAVTSEPRSKAAVARHDAAMRARPPVPRDVTDGQNVINASVQSALSRRPAVLALAASLCAAICRESRGAPQFF